MGIEKTLTVTSFDVMPDREIKPSALFRYYQQVAREHLDSLGLVLDVMLEKRCVFVITRMKQVFYSSIRDYDEISIKTSSRVIKGAVFTRDYCVTRCGETVAEASTQWALIDLDSRRICRPSVYADYFDVQEELCSFTDIKKSVMPESFDGKATYRVVFSDIDENYHMNNTRYTDICLDVIGGIDGGIGEISVDFLSEARLDDELVIHWSEDDGTYFFSAENLTSTKNCFNAVIKKR